MLHLICWAEPACWEAGARISSRTTICSIAWSFFYFVTLLEAVDLYNYSGDPARCEQNAVWSLLWSVAGTEFPRAGQAQNKNMGPGPSSGVWAWRARLKQEKMIVWLQISTDWPHFHELFKGWEEGKPQLVSSAKVFLRHFQCKWNLVLINYYPESYLEFSEIRGSFFSFSSSPAASSPQWL